MPIINTNSKKAKNRSQLELELMRPLESDRNFDLGGRSFYFFDFDDNVIFLSTPIVLFHKKRQEEILVSSGEFARENKNIGQSGIFADYYMNFNDENGSFRSFRDKDYSVLERFLGKNNHSFMI